jgi:hypothetical protein
VSKVKLKFRPYFRVGRQWKHLDSPKFNRAECAADYAGRFYLVLRWKIIKVRP